MTSSPKFSPSALNRFLGCEHRTYLDLLKRRGQPAGERMKITPQDAPRGGRRSSSRLLLRAAPRR